MPLSMIAFASSILVAGIVIAGRKARSVNGLVESGCVVYGFGVPNWEFESLQVSPMVLYPRAKALVTLMLSTV